MEQNNNLIIIREKVNSKEDFLRDAIRYHCSVCGAAHTSLEVFDDDDIILCPRCEFFASYENESDRPEEPITFNIAKYVNTLERLY